MRYEFHKEGDQHLLIVSLEHVMPGGSLVESPLRSTVTRFRSDIRAWLSANHIDQSRFMQRERAPTGDFEFSLHFDTKEQALEFKLRWG